MKTAPAIVLTIGFLSACGQDEEALAAQRAFGQHLGDARAEMELHHDSAMQAMSMHEMMMELSRHEGAMDGHMANMDRQVPRMGGCMGMSGNMDGMGGMSLGAMMDDTHGMVDGHRAEIEGAADLGAAQTLCTEYNTEMLHMMDRMEDRLEEMDCH